MIPVMGGESDVDIVTHLFQVGAVPE